MRLPRRGLPLLALLTLAVLALSRVPKRAPRDPSVLSPADGLPALPGLLLAPESLDLGLVEPGSRHDVAVDWRRAGPGPVRLLATRLGCGCLRLEGLPSLLEAGAHGAAVLTLVAPAEPGPVDASARLVLDLPPPADVLRVRLRAFVGRTVVVRPAWLDLGRRLAGAHVSARFAVHLPPGADPEDVVAEVAGWPGTARLERAAFASQHGPDLVLDTVLPAGPGPLVGALTVITRAAGEVVAALRVHVVEPPVPRQAPPGP